MEKTKKTKKPLTKAKAILIYALCLILTVGWLVGNYYAHLYSDLISVYLSGSGTVTTASSEEVCQKIEEEGMVLLKNDEALPLAKGAKLTLLGQDSIDFVYGGAGSGSVDTSIAPTLKDALEKSGFDINEKAWSFYTEGPGKDYRKSVPNEQGKGDFAVNEVPADKYTDDVIGSFKDYNDAALVCIGRSGGESADIPTTELSTGSRYLQLDSNEMDLLKLACENFDKVVLILNANNALELGFLEDPAYENVKAAVWVGGVGQMGMYAIGEALAGETNFSGKLVDTYAYDSLSAPSSSNIGDFNISNSDVKNGAKYLVYGENIYVGYRYYETRYEDMILGQGNAGDYNYAKTVQFPFGYGLSYTDFEWSGYSVTENDDTFSVEVTVKNTGDAAGKDVVQVYMQSPYTEYDQENGVEKASVELVGFAKTEEIKAGEEATVTVEVDKEVMKAYDSEGAGTYILDAGDYYFTAADNAHEAINNILAAKGKTTADGMDADGNKDFTYVATVDTLDTTLYASSAATGEQIENQLSDVDIRYYDSEYKYLSRSDWQGTWPKLYSDGSMTAPGGMLEDLKYYRGEEVVDNGAAMPTNESGGELLVSDAAGKEYDDPIWDELVNQLPVSKMTQLVRMGGYATVQIDAIGLPATTDKDGPSGISGTLVGGKSAMAYPVEVVMASTWNTDLLYQMGLSLGEDSIAIEVAGWYAPGVNIHRSPYSGRNFEYFSEDGFLSGKMGAAEVTGAREKGVITYMKHFALNDQETNRYGGAIFANEQAVREIFLKGFEYTVREGNSNAAMAAMNRIGARWVGAHKGLMTNILRNEWGFEGMVITDQASVPGMFYQDMISGLWAGTDMWLNTNKNFWKLDAYPEFDGSTKDYTSNATVMNNAHRAAKNVVYAVAGSNAMGTVSDDGTTSKGMELWETALVIADILIWGGSLIVMVWTTVRLVKQKKAAKITVEETKPKK